MNVQEVTDVQLVEPGWYLITNGPTKDGTARTRIFYLASDEANEAEEAQQAAMDVLRWSGVIGPDMPDKWHHGDMSIWAGRIVFVKKVGRVNVRNLQTEELSRRAAVKAAEEAAKRRLLYEQLKREFEVPK